MLISGWQPRWFVLDGGTLSYYDSQEDAWKGCKGSIKISVCEIQGWYSLPTFLLYDYCAKCDFFFYYYFFLLSHAAGKYIISVSPLCFISSFLRLNTSWPHHTRRAVLLPQGHQRSWEAEMACGAGNSQSLPYRQQNKERKGYLYHIITFKFHTAWLAITLATSNCQTLK